MVSQDFCRTIGLASPDPDAGGLKWTPKNEKIIIKNQFHGFEELSGEL
jgi:hypothetical protein